SRSSHAAAPLCQSTSQVAADGELAAGPACWPTGSGSSAWPLPARIRFLHGASAGGSTLKRIFQVFTHHARLTLLHIPSKNRLLNRVTAALSHQDRSGCSDGARREAGRTRRRTARVH